MAITNQNRRNQYTADGGTLDFIFTFEINSADDIGIYLDNVIQPTGWTIDAGSIDNPAGGTVTFLVAPISGTIVTLLRDVDIDQPTTYAPGSKFPAVTHEGALDFIVMQNQQQQEEIDRRITWPVNNETTSVILPDPTVTANQGQVLGINADGTAIVVAGAFTPGTGTHAQNTDIGTDSTTFTLQNTLAVAPTSDVSLVVERGTSPDVRIRWNETTDQWEFTNDGSTFQTFESSQETFTFAGNVVAASTTTQFNLGSFANEILSRKITITETGGLVTGTYDLKIYETTSFLAAGLQYELGSVNPASPFIDRLPVIIIDGNTASQLHVEITNDDVTNSGTYTIEIECRKFA